MCVVHLLRKFSDITVLGSHKGLSDQMRSLRAAHSRGFFKKIVYSLKRYTHLTYALHAAGVNGPVDFSLFI